MYKVKRFGVTTAETVAFLKKMEARGYEVDWAGGQRSRPTQATIRPGAVVLPPPAADNGKGYFDESE